MPPQIKRFKFSELGGQFRLAGFQWLATQNSHMQNRGHEHVFKHEALDAVLGVTGPNGFVQYYLKRFEDHEGGVPSKHFGLHAGKRAAPVLATASGIEPNAADSYNNVPAWEQPDLLHLLEWIKIATTGGDEHASEQTISGEVPQFARPGTQSPGTLPGSKYDGVSSTEETERLTGLLFDLGAESASYEPFGADHERELRELSRLIRRGQPAFRSALLIAYDGKCALSGCDVAEALEAAHIVPYSEGGKDDVSNGLLLRADLHSLLDHSNELIKLRVSPRGEIEVDLDDTLKAHYGALAFRAPRDPKHAPSSRAIARRWGVPKES